MRYWSLSDCDYAEVSFVGFPSAAVKCLLDITYMMMWFEKVVSVSHQLVRRAELILILPDANSGWLQSTGMYALDS